MTNGFSYHLTPRLNIEEMLNHPNIAVIGLGYVGMPLAVEFGKKFVTTGYDLSTNKIALCRQRRDPAGDIPGHELRSAQPLMFTSDPAPVDSARQPDPSPLVSTSETAGKYLKRGTTAIYESSVYAELPKKSASRHCGAYQGCNGKWISRWTVRPRASRSCPAAMPDAGTSYRTNDDQINDMPQRRGAKTIGLSITFNGDYTDLSKSKTVELERKLRDFFCDVAAHNRFATRRGAPRIQYPTA